MTAYQLNTILCWLLFTLPIVSATNIRLVGGKTPYSGRVEVEHDGVWGTVCDDDFTVNSAKVVCRMLGFTDMGLAEVVPPSVFGPGSGVIMLDSLNCIGHEEDVANCSHNSWKATDCAHREDVGVNCQTHLRLTSGNTIHDGQVEVNISGIWEPICADNFTISEAMVVCGMMGFGSNGAQLPSPRILSKQFSPISYNCKAVEKDISMCTRWNGTTCSSSSVASVNCRTPIRLVNGTSAQSGRVEVEYRGQWGTICDDNFDDLEAKVICRMIGYSTKDAKALGGAYYGEGSGSISIDEMRCTGRESDISECKSSDWLSPSNCLHNEDASVKCRSEVRLQDGPKPYSGRLEILNGSSWNTVCSDLVDNKTAMVVCNMLGFEQGNITVYNDGRFHTGSGRMELHGYRCTGNETEIADCEHTDYVESCINGTSVGFNCYSRTQIRLIGGKKSFNGRVEIYERENNANGAWRGICYAGQTTRDAQVLCRMLGLRTEYASIHDASEHYQSYGSFVAISGLGCNGGEADITGCTPANKWTLGACSTNDHAAINCGPEVRLMDGQTKYSGRLEILNGSTWETVCSDLVDNKTAMVVCRMLGFEGGNITMYDDGRFHTGTGGMKSHGYNCIGNETDIADCQQTTYAETCVNGTSVGFNCYTKTQIRLIDGTTAYNGRVELYIPDSTTQGSWKRICYDGRTQQDAIVLCKMLGLNNKYPTFHNEWTQFDSYGSSSVISGQGCRGDETDILECPPPTIGRSNVCGSTYSLAVNCAPNSTVRILDGSSVKSGRVEVFYNGTWLGICRQRNTIYDITATSINLLCKQLGFNQSGYLITSTSKLSQAMIPNLECSNTATDVSDCKSGKWGTVNSCTPAAIACNSTVRLVNSSSERSGRVEILHHGKWGTICAEGFGVKEANVVCRKAGIRLWNASVLDDSPFGLGEHGYLINNVSCESGEHDLGECKSSPWNETECDDGNVATVACKVRETPIRLTGGKTNYDGRVELYFENQWRPICHDNYNGKSSTDVLCRLQGYNFSRNAAFSNSYIYSNSLLRNLQCIGHESDISLCPSSDWGSYSCSNYGLTINCLSPISLHGGLTQNIGYVSVTKNGYSGYMCADNLTAETQAVMCKMLFNVTREYVEVDRPYFKPGFQTTVIVDNIWCTGTEEDYQMCPSSDWLQNTQCKNPALLRCNTPVRLEDSDSMHSGTVEIYMNSTWSNVCFDNNQNKAHAKMFCRMLGYNYGQAQASNVTTNKNSSLQLTCSGAEDDVSKCGRIVDEPCDSVLKISCASLMKLHNGRTKYMGQLRVQVGDYETNVGSIQNEKTVGTLCRLLGFNFTGNYQMSSVEFLRQKNTNSQKQISTLSCNGNETDIVECLNSTVYVTSSTQDIGINCQTSIRLNNGGSYLAGKFEVSLYKLNRTWLPVCSDGFHTNDAYVVCRMLGHTHARNATVALEAYNGTSLYGGFSCIGGEEDISQCQGYTEEITSTCGSGHVISINCQTMVRLADGPSATKGRVEVFYNDTWGPICRTGISTNEANIICRSAGFKYAYGYVQNSLIYSNITYSNYMITGLSCIGNEMSVTECNSQPWFNSSCSNTAPLELDCKTLVSLQPGVNKYYGWVKLEFQDYYQTKYSSLCGDGFSLNDADVICKLIGAPTDGNATIYAKNKFGNQYNNWIEQMNCTGTENDLQECPSKDWTETTQTCNDENRVVAINCRPNTPTRLQGSDPSKGLVEVYFDGSWHEICGYSFDYKAAAVICNKLGYKIGTPDNHQSSSYALIYDMRCNGDETDISQCQFPSSPYWRGGSYPWTRGACAYSSSYSDYYSHAGVICSNNRVRLVSSINHYQGRVEFQYFGVWGTVCNKHFDQEDARVICRLAGHDNISKITIHTDSKYGYGSGNLILEDLQCNGTETDIDECASYPWKDNYAQYPCNTHTMDVGVNCRPVTPLRLVGGTNYSGRVEIEYEGVWGTICDNGFDINDAKVICRMKGLSTKSVMIRTNGFYGIGNGQILLSNLNCGGDESDISECRIDYQWGNTYGYCYHNNEVAVQCNTPVRLREGLTFYSGIVEVFINDGWKRVCKENFTMEDAIAICNQAGKRDNYFGNVSIHNQNFANILAEHTTLGGFGCHGDEGDLYECGSGQWVESAHYCPSGDNVALNCRAQTPVRLMDGLHETRGSGKHEPLQGRVEIQYRRFDQSLQKYRDDYWGTICDDQFGDDDALVLCSMMGYSVGKVYRPEAEYPMFGNETILLDDLQCLGVEGDVSECKAREWGTHDCVHDEDVAIYCNYQDNIDPCDKENYKRLPSLEMRLVNFKTKSNPINDNKLSLGWYNVGNNTLPDQAPPMNRCATFFPVFSNDPNAVPKLEDKIKSFKAEQSGDSSITYDLQAKNCGGYFVYRLGPTVTKDSAYCFGIGSEIPPPSFVANEVGVVKDNNKTSIWFKCKFDPEQSENLYYQVEWHIIGNSEHVVTKQYCNKTDLSPCYLTHNDLEDMNIGMGTNISCAVRAFNEPNSQPGQLSLMSDPFFLGITVLTPRISLRRGEYKSVEMKLTVPIVCDNVRPSNNIACGVNIDYFTPDYGTCPNAEGNFPGGCSVAVNDTSFDRTITVSVSAAETGQYGVAGKFTLFLQIPRTRGVAFFSVPYKLPAIEVEVLPEMDRQWRGKLCTARNDPHMYTFDGRSYEHHAEEGDYILYKHSVYGNVEVQHRIANCTDGQSRAKCNCGVAVRAGRDVYVINVCNGYLDIGYRQCWDKALTVKKENDYTYTIYLPYGTAVRARIDSAPFMGAQGGRVLDISVNPSIQDRSGNSTGLCGSLNGNSADDFDNESQFINEWKVQRNASLFTNDSYHKDLEPWVFPTCTCKKTTGGNGAYSCDRSIAGCTRGTLAGYHSCGELLESRPVRSTTIQSRKPVIKIPVLHQRFHVRNRRSAGVWTDGMDARSHCEQQLKTIQDMCNKIPDTHTNVSLENCVLDIKITNSSAWLAMSKQSMLQTCQNEIQRNSTVIKDLIERAENKNTTTTGAAETHITTVAPPTLAELNILKEILKTSETIEERFCMNNCSGSGICVNGTCQCNSGFGAVDCSIDLKKPPIISGILDHGLCDQNKTDCSKIVVFGGEFTSSNLTCRLNTFYFDIHGTPHNESRHEVPGHAETIVETICPLHGLRQRRSIDNRFVVGFHVSVSNDGENYDDDKQGLAYIYNSQCQTYGFAKDTEWIYTFSLKDGFCFIEGQCYYNGTFHISQKMICDPLANQTSWTTYTPDCKQDEFCKTKRNSVCEIMNTTVQCSCARGYKQNESDSNNCAEISETNTVPDEVYDGRHSHVVLEVKLDYILPQGLTLNSSTTYERYELELRTKLTEYYKGLLGEQFSKVVIKEIKIGSLIVEHWVLYVQNEQNTVNAYDALTRHSERQLVIFGQTVHVLNVSIVNNEGCTSPMTCSKKKNSLCEVWEGVKQCSCIRGYIESETTPSTCVENTHAIIVPDENALSDDAHGVLQVEIKLGYSLPLHKSLNASDTYDHYVKELNTSLTEFYKDEIGHWLSKVVIRDIRPGSLYVDHLVVYEKREQILSDVTQAVVKLAENGLVISGKTYNVTNAFIGKEKVPLHDNTEEKKSEKCRVYTSIHPCNDDEQCEVDDSVVRCVKKKTTQDSDSKLLVIVSATVGCALFLIIVVLVIIVCKKKAKQPLEIDHLEPKVHDNTYQDISAREMSVFNDDKSDVYKIPRAKLSGSQLAFKQSLAADVRPSSLYERNRREAEADRNRYDGLPQRGQSYYNTGMQL